MPCPVEPGSYNADTDYSSHWNTSSVAREGFSVTVDNAHVMLNDTISGAQFCLYLCNTPRPEVPGNPTYFEVPVDAVAVADPALASLLSRLHVEDTLVTIGDEASVVDACLQSRMDSGWINGTANYDVVFALSGSNVTGFNESRLVTLPILDVDDPVEVRRLARTAGNND